MNHKFDELAKGLAEPQANNMKKWSLLKNVALALGCAALVSGSHKTSAQATLPPSAANFVGNAGITFVLSPTPDPTIFTIAVDGVASLSLLGNCSEHAEVQVQFSTIPGQPATLSGTATLTSSDGANSVTLTVNGTATPDPANPAFFNNHDEVTITGGTGAFASASGSGALNEVVKFSSQVAGTGTWSIKAHVLAPPQGL
jgi:hypothetical protein